MNTSIYIGRDEVMSLLGIGSKKAYELIRRANSELEAKGVFVIRGRCLRSYFLKRLGVEIPDPPPKGKAEKPDFNRIAECFGGKC